MDSTAYSVKTYIGASLTLYTVLDSMALELHYVLLKITVEFDCQTKLGLHSQN